MIAGDNARIHCIWENESVILCNQNMVDGFPRSVNAVIKFLIRTLSLLPLPMARALGAVIGEIAWLVRSDGARTAIINLELCFPEFSAREVRRLAARSMRHWGMTLCEIPVVWRKAAGGFAWIKEVTSSEVVDRAVAAGKGVIFVSPHLGNWEFMGLWAGSHGPITTLYQPPRRFDLDALLQEVRAGTGAKLVPTNARGVASLVKALKQGENAGILPDMVPAASGGVFAPFFGRPALTMTLIHSLVQRTGCAIILCFAQRTAGGFNIVLREPGEDIASDNAEKSAAELNRVITEMVKLSPEQYQWEYKRFKRDPDGGPSIYKESK